MKKKRSPDTLAVPSSSYRREERVVCAIVGRVCVSAECESRGRTCADPRIPASKEHNAPIRLAARTRRSPSFIPSLNEAEL